MDPGKADVGVALIDVVAVPLPRSRTKDDTVITISITDAKTEWSDLVASAAAGETVCITKYGKPVARLTAIEEPRVPVDLGELRALTDSLPRQTETAGAFVRAMRHTDRY